MIVPPELTDQEFVERMLDPAERRKVANAHVCCDEFSKPLFRKTCDFPTHLARRVTEEQIVEARRQRDEDAARILREHRHDLLFTGMGVERKGAQLGEVSNHRFRTRLLNRQGHNIFVEFSFCFGRCAPNLDGEGYVVAARAGLHVDHCFMGSDCNENLGGYRKHEVGSRLPCTEKAVLAFVNIHLDCNFKRMLIDNYTIDTPGDEPVCFSPKRGWSK